MRGQGRCWETVMVVSAWVVLYAARPMGGLKGGREELGAQTLFGSNLSKEEALGSRAGGG